MNDQNRELIFNNAFCERVKSLRIDRGWTAEQMAVSLGIPADRYRKYEGRSMLPTYLIEPFCLAADCEISYLVTGKRVAGASRPAADAKKRA